MPLKILNRLAIAVSDSRKTTILPFSSPLCVSLFHTISKNYPPPQIEQQTKIASPGSRRFERKIGSRHGDPSSFGSASSVRPPRDKASGREGAAQKSSVCWRAAFRLELGVAEERRRYRGQWPHGAMVQCAIARKRGERRGERESRLRSDPRAETLKRGSRVGRSGEERRDR